MNDSLEQMSSCQVRLAAAEQQAQRLDTENRRLLVELEETKLDAKENARSAGQHVIDKGRLQQQNEDMRKQVIRLLKEVATLKSGGLETFPDNEHPAVYGSVEEMQHKNIELLSLVKELQIKAQSAEKAVEDMEIVADCNDRLEELLDQVKRYQEREETQTDMMKLLIRQRDHFEEVAKTAEKNAQAKVAELQKQLSGPKEGEASSTPATPVTDSASPSSDSLILSPRTPAPGRLIKRFN